MPYVKIVAPNLNVTPSKDCSQSEISAIKATHCEPFIMPTGHAKATVGDFVIAEADRWEEVEGNVYFPPSSVKSDYLSKTDLSTHCPWKGDASYYTIKAGGKAHSPHILGTMSTRIADPERRVFLQQTKS